MKKGLESGVGLVEIVVTTAMTAHLEDLVQHPVYATYWLAYHAELAGRRAIQPFFDEGENAVGTAIELKHLAMAGVGATVLIRASVTSVEGATIRCSIQAIATRTKAQIAIGTVDQVVVREERLTALIASAES